MYQSGIVKQSRDHFVYFLGTNDFNYGTNYTWPVPREARFLYMTTIGGAGGGQAGTGNSAGTSRAGGAGGGSAGVSHALYLTRMLPSLLYLNVGGGGTGGVTSAAVGNTGLGTYIAATATTGIAESTILYANGGTGGGSGGQAGVQATLNNTRVAYRAISFNPVAAQLAGGSGGTAGGIVDPTSQTYNAFLGGGVGGAGTNTSTPHSGANVVTFGNDNIFQVPATTFLVPGGVAGGYVDGCDGHSNFPNCMFIGASVTPMYFLGGSGGASSDAGAGGKGGHGAWGCGGGGGGAGVTGSHGIGGNGGPGLIIIEWWE